MKKPIPTDLEQHEQLAIFELLHEISRVLIDQSLMPKVRSLLSPHFKFEELMPGYYELQKKRPPTITTKAEGAKT